MASTVSSALRAASFGCCEAAIPQPVIGSGAESSPARASGRRSIYIKRAHSSAMR